MHTHNYDLCGRLEHRVGGHHKLKSWWFLVCQGLLIRGTNGSHHWQVRGRCRVILSTSCMFCVPLTSSSIYQLCLNSFIYCDVCVLENLIYFPSVNVFCWILIIYRCLSSWSQGCQSISINTSMWVTDRKKQHIVLFKSLNIKYKLITKWPQAWWILLNITDQKDGAWPSNKCYHSTCSDNNPDSYLTIVMGQ